MDPLKFHIAIENKKALEDLDKVQKALNGLKNTPITIEAKGLEGLNDLITKLSKEGGAVKIQLPDLTEVTNQLKSVKGITDSLFSKQNWQDIPAFGKALEQIGRLNVAFDELNGKKNIALNSGRNSAVSNGILGLQGSVAEIFQELPNTHIKSAIEFLKMFSAEFDKLKEKMQTPLGSAIARGTQEEFNRLRQQFESISNLSNDSAGLKAFQQQVKGIVTVLVQGMVEVQQAIRQAKQEIQNDNFSAFSKRIEHAATAMNGLVEAFGRFNLTIGQDQGLKDFMTGLGEVIRNVRSTMQSLGQSENAGFDKIANQYNRNVERMEDALFRLQEARAKVTMAIQEGEAAGMNVSGWKIYLQTLDAYEKKLQSIKANEAMMYGDGWQTKAFGTTFKHMLSNADDFVRMAKSAQKEQDRWAESMRRATVEATSLDVLLRKLRSTEKAGSAIGADTASLRSYIELLERYKTILDSIKGGDRLWNAGAVMSGAEKISGELGLPNAIKLANEAEQAVRKETTEIQRNQAEKQKAASATSQLTAEEQRLAQALTQTTEHAKGQSQVLSDLKSMAMQYLGVWGGQQFLHNIIEIGGQLEMQRLSIGSILQNQSQANDLFEKIKGLAVQSPFGVVELDQMTKQLTAYGYKYNELFDMTKRLADISAATGTGVDRLALALGHVKSEAALSGYTLRQFAMGNVPLLAKLSEKLGKTTQEIRKMVRAKEVSYEDVVGVIKDLTDEGGMFYNMQEVISQSVKARFKNVKDAMAIMYGEMAESGVGDALKGVADALMEVTKNWKDVATVITSGAAAWGVYRAAMLTNTAAIGQNNAAVLSSVEAYRQKEAAMLRQATIYRTLTLAEKKAILSSQEYTLWEKTKLRLHIPLTSAQKTRIALAHQQRIADLETALSTKKLTIEDLARLVALGKVTAAEARDIITKRMLAGAQRDAAIATIDGTKVLGFWGRAALAASGAAIKLGTALMSMFPQAALLAGVTALFELWQRNNAEMERAKELGDAIFEASQEGLKNTRMMMEQTGIKAYQTTYDKDGEMQLKELTKSFGTEQERQSKTFLVKPEFDSSTAQQIIDEWTQFIRDYAGTPNRLLNDALLDEAENVRTLKDQFDHLYESVVMVSNSQKAIVDIADAMQSAQESTGSGWFNEDIVEDIADYDNALRKYNKSIVQAYHDHSRAIKKGIDAARKADSLFAKNTEGMASYSEMLKELVGNSKKYSSFAGKAFKNAAEENTGILDTLFSNKSSLNIGATAEVEKEFKKFKENLRITLEGIGQDIENLSPDVKQGLMSMFIKKFLGQDKLSRLSKEAKDKFIKDFADFIGETVDEAEERTEKRLADWQKRADTAFVVNKEIKVKTKTTTSIDEFAQAVQKDLKEKQDYINRNASHVTHVLNIKTGIKFDLSTIDDQIIALSAQVQKLLAEGKLDAAKRINSIIQDELMPYHDALKSIQEDKKWLKSEGYPETDPTKNKKKTTKNKKTYKDPVAEEWRERIRLLKDANQLYKEWNKRTGEDNALTRVRDQYGEFFEKWKTDKDLPWENFDAADIVKYKEYVQKIVDAAQKRYDEQRKDKAKNYGKEAEAVLREGKKLLEDIDKYDFDEKAREFKSKTEKLIADLTRRWEIYNSVRDSTGNKSLALDIAGISGKEREVRDAAEAMRRMLTEQMREIGGDELLKSIPLNVYIDEESLRDQFKKALGDSEEYSTQIDALVKAYQEWQKLQQNVMKEDINAYAKVIGAAQDYAAQIQKINDELERQKNAISGSSANAQQKAFGIMSATADADWKKMKMSAQYANLYNNAIALSRDEFNKAADSIKNMIDYLRLLGRISPEEYKQEMEKLSKARVEFSTSGFLGEKGAVGQFFGGGFDGLMRYYQSRASAARETESKAAKGSKEERDAKAEADKYEKLYEQMEKMKDGAGKVVNALQMLQSGINLVADLFDSLGMEGAANAASDAGSILGGMMSGASSLSAFGPWGMAAGAALGGITGLMQMRDRSLEREIGKLRDEVSAIENNTALILKSRERELGYDSGNRDAYIQSYLESTEKAMNALSQVDFGDIQPTYRIYKANKSMLDYYQSGSNGNGYQQQYNNLIKEREDYIKILGDQEDMKNKSNSDIEETKAKIAELDDQIRYFTQDLAKELLDIDIKGWADQLSDALSSAFENGESVAKAYNDTVTKILQGLMNKMMQMSILEPMMEKLQTKLFGNGNEKGLFDPNNPKGSMGKVTAAITDYFGKGGEGEKAITASMEFMTAFQRAMENSGLTVLNEATNTLSSSVQGTTEETSDLLAGYVNALRQDVSINRIMISQFVARLWPEYIESLSNQITAVNNIDANVQVIMLMMQQGSGAMYNEIAALRTRIDNVVLGIDKFSIK